MLKNLWKYLFILILGCFILPSGINAQIRSGNGFLKILPGVRNQGLAGSYTGVIDEMHTLYANPAATGFLREWQWATSYTEWIADTYSLSWLAGKQIAMPWSQKTHFALGIHYQGVRDFNSTGNANIATASANDALFSLSVGNPLNAISKNISLGTNIKYFRSDLDGVTANSFIFDLGLLYRSNRFRIHFFNFDYGFFSAGVAVDQLGKALKFIDTETPLPRTFRAGAALNMGSHKGMQIQLAGDYQKVRDEIGRFSLGAEVTWRYLLGIRGGYNFNDHLLSKFSLGLSYRLGNLKPLPGKKKALRLDFAYLEGNDFFSAPLRGGINHYPVGPEKFDIYTSQQVESYEPTDAISLAWESSNDPDLYDDVRYVLLLAKDDSAALAEMVAQADDDQDLAFRLANDNGGGKGTMRWFTEFSNDPNFDSSSHLLIPETEHQPGDYYWTVLAYDRDGHARAAEKTGHFRIIKYTPPPPPPPVVTYDLQMTKTAIVQLLQPKIHFNFNKYTLTTEAKHQLDSLGKALQSPDLANVFVKLGGHTDQRGRAAYNQKLSRGRVNRVKRYLEQAHHIDGNRIFAHGYGEKFLLNDADKFSDKTQQDSIHTLNRRVDIYLLRRADFDTTNRPIPDTQMIKTVFQGDPVYYQLEIVNNGPDTAKTVTILDALPPGAKYLPKKFSANIQPDAASTKGDSLSWQFEVLPPGASVTLKYALVVDGAVPANPYKLDSYSKVTAKNDVDLSNNSASDRVFVIPLPRNR